MTMFVVRARIGCDAEERFYGPFESEEEADRFGDALFGGDDESGIAGNPKDCTSWRVGAMLSPLEVLSRLEVATKK